MPSPSVAFFEVDERVIPDERELAFALQFGVEDVDQRPRRFEKDAPVRELLSGRS